MTWSAEHDALDARTRRTVVLRDGEPASLDEALRAWRDDESFRACFLGELASSPYAAYFWETPPVTRDTLDRAFEFVLKDAPSLARVPAQPDAFREHYAGSHADVATFWNLGRDALLVAPTPTGEFPHLAAFTAAADPGQQHALWRAVGAAAEERLSDEPLWISTSGLGVYWLHVRLDSTPKYYTHAPYRNA